EPTTSTGAYAHPEAEAEVDADANADPFALTLNHAPDASPNPIPDRDRDRDPADATPDDRLRLVFTCCHPALGVEAQIALTLPLRWVCGLPTRQIAQAFLASEATMAARVTRAKKKIAAARIPYRIPRADELPDRLNAALAVIHLVYTTGHTDPTGENLQQRE